MTPLEKLPKNVGDLGKLIAAKGFKKWPKVQKKITQSGHTDRKCRFVLAVVENSHELCKGKYHCMAGLQFYWLGFIQPCKIYRLFNVEKLLNYNQSNHGSRWW